MRKAIKAQPRPSKLPALLSNPPPQNNAFLRHLNQLGWRFCFITIPLPANTIYPAAILIKVSGIIFFENMLQIIHIQLAKRACVMIESARG